MSDWRAQQRKFYEDYYSGAIGLEIVGFKWSEGSFDDEPFPVLVCKNKHHITFELEISRDPEGNGPGHLFGLPEPVRP